MGGRASSTLGLPRRRADLKAAVLMGGISREREVSLQSGRRVEEALKEVGVNVVAVDITPDNLGILDDKTIDVFFLALHGHWGEDGSLQEILEKKQLVYTGSGPLASQLAFDKVESKRRFAAAGVTVPAEILFDPAGDTKQMAGQLERIAAKYVVKPVREGSTIGVSIADDTPSAIAAAGACAAEFGECMIEEYIAGRELTVGILDGRALPIIEIRAPKGFYDYDAKYVSERTQYLFDTIEDGAAQEQLQSAAVKCFEALGCRHLARVDFILRDDGKVFALEINTIPGMTTHSLLPKAAAKIGLSMSDLCLKIIDAAIEDRRQ